MSLCLGKVARSRAACFQEDKKKERETASMPRSFITANVADDFCFPLVFAVVSLLRMHHLESLVT